MKCYTPYCYLIGWSKLNKYYYGVRHAKEFYCIYDSGCHPDDLLTSYPTSSKKVKFYREQYGEPDVVKIRKTFNNANSAILWESKVLRRMDAMHKDKWLNDSNNKSMNMDSEARSTMVTGKGNPRYQAFIIHAEYDGEVTDYVCDGESPVAQAREIGLTAAKQSLLKKGGEWIVHEKGTRSRSRHPWLEGTKVTITLIK